MKYDIGNGKAVTVEEKDGELFVSISEENSLKSVTLPAQRWAQFVACKNEIDESVKQLSDDQQHVKLFIHVGGAWFVSVNTGFACVDIRQFYHHARLGERPTKTGIALRIPEWHALRDLLTQIHIDHPILTSVSTCTHHFNEENCQECNPFHWCGPFLSQPT